MNNTVPGNALAGRDRRHRLDPAGSVARRATDFLAGEGRTHQVRRLVLSAQLTRLAIRIGGADPAARDAEARAVRLTTRLERDHLDW